MGTPIDVVYTWVDDGFPGYLELLGDHAETPHDRNPNRTRDNLELLRFSLRSLSRYAPWVGRVYLVTCRPQLPAWLDPEASNLTIVHHDQIIDAEVLPTFNSFAILSHLYRIEGLSDRFLYFEDDMLLGNRTLPSDFIAAPAPVRDWRWDLHWLGYSESHLGWRMRSCFAIRAVNSSRSQERCTT